MVHCQQVGKAENDGKPWYHDIREYLKGGVYPLEVTENDKKRLRRLAIGFLLSGVILLSAWGSLRHSRQWPRPRPQNPSSRILLVQDGVRLLPTCEEMHEPKASNGHRFILVAIDYFTKWVEAASYANVTKSVVIKFIKRDIICYELLARIITNNGTNLNNKMMTELCEQFKIKHHNSTPYRPKMNEAVEAANKNLNKIIQKLVVTYKEWYDMLPYTLHLYQKINAHVHRGNPLLIGVRYRGGSPGRSRNTLSKSPSRGRV
ncbi:Pol polyprotein, partial [Mucuna pruriens]